MSLVLSGKKELSVKSAATIAEHLGFSDDEKEYFCALVSLHKTKDKSSQKAIEKKIEVMFKLMDQNQNSVTEYKIIADTDYFTLIELLKMKSIRPSVASLAKKLSISEELTLKKISDLLKLGLIKKNTAGFYSPTTKHVSSADKTPSDAIKEAHENILTKAKKSVREQKIDERDLFANVISFRKSDLPKVQKEIRKFMSQLAVEYNNEESGEDVYCISTQVFNFTP